MQDARPRFVLIVETESVAAGDRLWRFALHSADGSETIAASDHEPDADRDRLTLLAAVRGLEAVDGPSHVTVVTRNTTLLRGLTRGIEQWRASQWRWERYGRLEPIRDADLWRRVDQTLRYHTVRCRTWRVDRPGKPRPAAARPAAAPAVAHPTVRAQERLGRPHVIDGRPDSPAMVIVRSSATRRRLRFDAAVAAAG